MCFTRSVPHPQFIEFGLLIVAVITIILPSRIPDPDPLYPLPLFELPNEHEVVVDLPAVPMVLALLELPLIYLARDPALPAEPVLLPILVDLPKILF